MTDLTVVAANVQPTANLNTKRRTAGEVITAGQAVFINASGALELSSNDLTAPEAECDGIALQGCAAGHPCEFGVRGEIDMGVILTIGEVYVVGAAAGGIAPHVDPGVGDFGTLIGVATTTSLLKLAPLASGAARV